MDLADLAINPHFFHNHYNFTVIILNKTELVMSGCQSMCCLYYNKELKTSLLSLLLDPS